MTLNTVRLLPIFGMLLLCSVSLAQGPTTHMELNRAPLRYYSGVELKQLAEEAPEKSEQIKYYFTESFIAKPVNCDDCKVNPSIFYNQDVFNVAEHEAKRQQSTQVTFVYRDKYEITLLSFNEITTHLGINPAEVLKLKIERPMPTWANTGDNDADYTLYKTQLREWIIDFPEEYRTITRDGDLLRITITEFLACSEEKRETIMSHEGGYLLMD